MGFLGLVPPVCLHLLTLWGRGGCELFPALLKMESLTEAHGTSEVVPQQKRCSLSSWDLYFFSSTSGMGVRKHNEVRRTGLLTSFDLYQ